MSGAPRILCECKTLKLNAGSFKSNSNEIIGLLFCSTELFQTDSVLQPWCFLCLMTYGQLVKSVCRPAINHFLVCVLQWFSAVLHLAAANNQNLMHLSGKV